MRFFQHQPLYDPVFTPVSHFVPDIIGIAETGARKVKKYSTQLTAIALTSAGYFHPAVRAVNLAHFMYRGAQHIERERPGFWMDAFHSTLSHAADSWRYWTGDHEFDDYSVKGESWKEYDRQRQGKPSRPVYPIGDLF